MAKIWLIGAGPMARDYIKVLESLQSDYITIGRGEASAAICEEMSTKDVIRGGIDVFLSSKPEKAQRAIIAVPVQDLRHCAEQLIKYGIKDILIEKPAGIDKAEIESLEYLRQGAQANVLLAYNRRFYSSVLEAQKMISEDGGATSCHFEFTEWSHVIEKLNKPEQVFQHWFLGNSTHVVDLAFHMIGAPLQLSCFNGGALNWHQSSSIFCGAGVTTKEIPFSYHANWAAPGRWSVEVLTQKRRFVFKPMEELRVIPLGSVKDEKIEIDDHLDKEFKPGLYLQTKNFLHGQYSTHCSLQSQLAMMDTYNKIANYK